MTDKTPLLADDEIKALAREAGCLVVTDRYGTMTFQAYGDNLRKFVALVAERAAAAEREACAQVCDEKSAKVLSMQMGNDPHDLPNVMLRHQSVAHLEDAAAIRARGAK